MRYLLLPILLSACALSPLYGSEADAAPLQLRLHRSRVTCDADGTGRLDAGQEAVLVQAQHCEGKVCTSASLTIDDGLILIYKCDAIEAAGQQVFVTWLDGPVDEG